MDIYYLLLGQKVGAMWGHILYLSYLAGSIAVFSSTWINDWPITHKQVAAVLFCLEVSIHMWERFQIWCAFLDVQYKPNA